MVGTGRNPRRYRGSKRSGVYTGKRTRNDKQDKAISAVKKQVKSIVTKEEVKWLDTYLSPTVLNQTINATKLLNGVLEGSGSTQREGISVTSTSLMVKMNVYSEPTNATVNAAQRVRCIIVWDSQANGGLPLLNGNTDTASILDTTVVSDITMAPYNRSNTQRYRLVYDKLMYFPPVSAAGATSYFGTGDSKNNLFMISKKFKLSRKIKYNAGGLGIAQINTNSLLIYVFTNNAANTNMVVTYAIRYNFKDD